MDALVQQSFMRLPTLDSAYCSGNLKNAEDRAVEEALLRLFAEIKNKYHQFLTSEEMKKIDVVMAELLLNGHAWKRQRNGNVDSGDHAIASTGRALLENRQQCRPYNLQQLTPNPDDIMVDVRSSASKSNDQESASTSSCQGEGDISSAPQHSNDNQQEENTVEIDEDRKEEEQNKSFRGRKLSLVLDLDHTLLHSVAAAELDSIQNEKLFKMVKQEPGKPQQHLFCLRSLRMWTKLRPGIWNFLDKASKLYELHVYTLGMKSYAAEIVKILDPTGKLFQGRVISRGDHSDDLPNGGGESPLIKDFSKVQRLESDVLIMDDTIKVWPHNQRNLIAVESYNYFPKSRQPSEPCEPSFLESDSDERADIGTLSSLLTVIERIHGEFFSFLSLEGIDVRNTLASQKRRILSGCKILFSGISSMNEDKPHLHPLWQTCQEFGAVCTTRIDQSVTHVVAECFGAEKVKWAHFNGNFIVNPDWIKCSAFLYHRAKENNFSIKTKSQRMELEQTIDTLIR